MAGERDPSHWLYRFGAAEWLAAAENELRHADVALGRRSTRTAVTHARRAAGMAWNAVLVGHFDERYGRSYMEHIAALAADDGAPADLREAALVLRDTRPVPPTLVQIGRPDDSFVQAARAIVAHAAARAGVPSGQALI